MSVASKLLLLLSLLTVVSVIKHVHIHVKTATECLICLLITFKLVFISVYWLQIYAAILIKIYFCELALFGLFALALPSLALFGLFELLKVLKLYEFNKHKIDIITNIISA